MVLGVAVAEMVVAIMVEMTEEVVVGVVLVVMAWAVVVLMILVVVVFEMVVFIEVAIILAGAAAVDEWPTAFAVVDVKLAFVDIPLDIPDVDATEPDPLFFVVPQHTNNSNTFQQVNSAYLFSLNWKKNYRKIIGIITA